MRVNELAQKVNVTSDTVRYYARIGLLTPSKSPDNGYKYFSSGDESRLIFILKAKSLGFSVSEIQEIIEMSKKGNSPCCKVREWVNKHIDETDKKIKELQRLQDHMKQATETWGKMPDSVPDGQSVCELIEMWEIIEQP